MRKTSEGLKGGNLGAMVEEEEAQSHLFQLKYI